MNAVKEPRRIIKIIEKRKIEFIEYTIPRDQFVINSMDRKRTTERHKYGERHCRRQVMRRWKCEREKQKNSRSDKTNHLDKK